MANEKPLTISQSITDTPVDYTTNGFKGVHSGNPYAPVRKSNRYADDPYTRASQLYLPASSSQNPLRRSLAVGTDPGNRASSVLLPSGIARDLSRSDLIVEASRRRYQSGMSTMAEDAGSIHYSNEVINSKSQNYYEDEGPVSPVKHWDGYQHRILSQAQPYYHGESPVSPIRDRTSQHVRNVAQAQPYYEEDYSTTPYSAPLGNAHQHQQPRATRQTTRNFSHRSPPKITLNDSSDDIVNNVLPSLPPPNIPTPQPTYDSIFQFEDVALDDVTRVHNRDSLSGTALLDHVSKGTSPTTFEGLEKRGAIDQTHVSSQDGDGDEDEARARDDAYGMSDGVDTKDIGRERKDSAGVKSMIADWEGKHGRYTG